MRITHLQLNRNFLNNLNRTLTRLERIQNQISSGLAISRPEDDPTKVVEILRFSAEIADVDQFTRGAQRAEDFLSTSESALSSITNALQRARELAVHGGNGTLSDSDLTSIQNEVIQIIQGVLTSTNARFGGRYLFAGTKTTTQPYTLNTGTWVATYAGNSKSIDVEIDRGQTLSINMPGDTTLPGVFTALKGLIDNLGLFDSAAVGSTSLQAIDDALDNVLKSRADVGARIQRSQSVADRLADLQVRQRSLLSNLQDLDFAEGITELAMAETTYRASLAAGARVLQPSLLDFLR